MTSLPVVPGAPLVALLVDRSGSMSSCLDEMQSGLNEFVAEQAAEPGDAALMLAQFDTSYEILWPLRSIHGAPRYRLEPRGRTALCDAIGGYITDISTVLSTEELWRPVIVCIVTDGKENASVEWDRAMVKEWIQYQQDSYGWTFIFLGANLDAVDEAAAFGIPTAHALTFDVRNGKRCYKLLSKQVAALRTGKRAAFSSEDRRKAIER